MRSSDDAFSAAANLSVEIVGRRVRCPRDMFRWERSEAMAEVVAFVERINAVTKRGPPTALKAGGNVDEAALVLRRVAGWATEHEPATDGSGCGLGGALAAHRCFREFHGRLRADGRDLLTRAYATPGDHRTVELQAYLERSFGDPDVAAYGPQHELSFCMFLIALFKLHCLTSADEPYVVPVLFDSYLDVVDRLVHRYGLEPRDEYGDSALNDYRFVGFLWGSAQMAAAAPADHGCSPAVVIADRSGKRGGMFAKCVDATYRRAASRAEELGRTRPDPVWRHSYQLWNLSAWSRWDRVNECLMVAFRPQVLDRFRIVRHLVFGELLRFARNRRPPGVSFYDCIPAAPTSVTATAAVTAMAAAGEDCNDEDGEKTDVVTVVGRNAAESLRLQLEAEEECE